MFFSFVALGPSNLYAVGTVGSTRQGKAVTLLSPLNLMPISRMVGLCLHLLIFLLGVPLNYIIQCRANFTLHTCFIFVSK
jgi:hypothetical protein